MFSGVAALMIDPCLKFFGVVEPRRDGIAIEDPSFKRVDCLPKN